MDIDCVASTAKAQPRSKINRDHSIAGEVAVLKRCGRCNVAQYCERWGLAGPHV
jgi:hypothetical protein